MAKYPSMPLFPDAWIADTQHLTNEEQGVYFRLVMFAWRTPSCALPDDDRRLAMMVSLTQKNVEQKSRAGKASARAKALKKQETQQTAVSTARQHPEPEPEPHDDENKSSSSGVGETLKDDLEKILAAVGHSIIPPLDWRDEGLDWVRRWQSAGLTADQMVQAAKDHRQNVEEPPFSPRGLDKAMRRALGQPVPISRGSDEDRATIMKLLGSQVLSVRQMGEKLAKNRGLAIH